jgi:hypothetical protein
VASWRGERDAARLRAQTLNTYKAELALMQRTLERLRTSEDTTELREAGLEVVKTASKQGCDVCDGGVGGGAGRCGHEAGGRWQEWLVVAAREGRCETVRALAKARAEVDCVDDEGEIALPLAPREGLVAAGAAVDHTDNEGYTALFSADDWAVTEEAV